jgi:hypothetical protein
MVTELGSCGVVDVDLLPYAEETGNETGKQKRRERK